MTARPEEWCGLGRVAILDPTTLAECWVGGLAPEFGSSFAPAPATIGVVGHEREQRGRVSTTAAIVLHCHRVRPLLDWLDRIWASMRKEDR
jgi:hypothetical protein